MTPRPDSTWKPSPNFRTPRRKPVTAIIIHATAGECAGALRTLCDPRTDNPAARVSAHYLVDRDGTITHLVHESDEAWHAGESIWNGVPNVNDFSVGIELVNRNDGLDPYPEPQLAACAALVKAIMTDYGVQRADVVGHVDIVDGATPEDKAARLLLHSDPKAFPWEDFRARLAA